MVAIRKKQPPFDRKKTGGIYVSLRGVVIAALIVATLLMIALALFVLMPSLRRPALERGCAAMIAAFKNRRLIDARVSGDFAAGLYDPTLGADVGIDTEQLKQAHDLIEEVAVNSKDYEAQMARARLSLMSKEIDQARKKLLQILNEWPQSSEAHNDLGVCLIQYGRLEKALKEFDLALEYNPETPEALFNRAHCYQQLQLREVARDDLIALQKIESDQSWLKEINRRLEQVSNPFQPKDWNAITRELNAALGNKDMDAAKQIIDNNPELVIRLALTDKVSEAIESAAAAKREETERILWEIETIGEVFSDTRQDSVIADLARYLRNLSDSKRAAQLKTFRRYTEAIKMIQAGKYAEAEPIFASLLKTFDQQQNFVLEAASISALARCQISTGEWPESIKTLEKAVRLGEKRSWPSYMAQISNNLGNAYSRLGEDSQAISYHQRAIDLCSKYPDFKAKSQQFMSLAYWHLGSLDKGLDFARQSTQIYLSNGGRLRELAYNYLQLADLYRLSGHNSLAMHSAEQALKFAKEANDKNRAAQALSFLALERGATDQVKRAESNLKRAFEYLNEIRPNDLSYTKPLILTRAGEWALNRKDLSGAVKYYSEAKALIEATPDKIRPQTLQLRALQGRAEAYYSSGRFVDAESDLKAARSLVEVYRSNIAEGENRSAFLEASQSVFDRLIALCINRHKDEAEAFDLSEQSRARTLLDEISGDRNAPPLNLAQVRNDLPDNLTVLVYSVTSEGTYIFLVTRSGLQVTQSQATTEMLDRLVSDYLFDLNNRAEIDALNERAKELHQWLIAPIEQRLKGVKNLCIVPDKSLNFLPFAALVDAAGRYLIESYHPVYAPSASVLARCIQVGREKIAVRDEKILAVGNPSFDHAKFHLDNLPEAEDEATGIAALYGNNRPALKRDEALEIRVRSDIQDCDVAHFAVHCLVQERSPWLAALVLATPHSSPTTDENSVGNPASGSEDGMLSFDEIYRLKIPRMRLVVLSACQSGLGQYYRGEGIVSLVRPFITARVPTVVASMWSVNSDATSQLMINFHTKRKGDLPGAGDALAAAQLEMANTTLYKHPFYWAPFIAVGSNY